MTTLVNLPVNSCTPVESPWSSPVTLLDLVLRPDDFGMDLEENLRGFPSPYRVRYLGRKRTVCFFDILTNDPLPSQLLIERDPENSYTAPTSVRVSCPSGAYIDFTVKATTSIKEFNNLLTRHLSRCLKA